MWSGVVGADVGGVIGVVSSIVTFTLGATRDRIRRLYDERQAAYIGFLSVAQHAWVSICMMILRAQLGDLGAHVYPLDPAEFQRVFREATGRAQVELGRLALVSNQATVACAEAVVDALPELSPTWIATEMKQRRGEAVRAFEAAARVSLSDKQLRADLGIRGFRDRMRRTPTA